MVINTRISNEVKDVFHRYKDKDKKRHAIQRFFLNIIMALVGAIITFISIRNGEEIGAEAILTLTGLIGAWLVIRNKSLASAWVIAISYTFVCFYFVVNGTNNGASICWALMIPMGVFVLTGLKCGIVLNVIICAAICVLFWSPLNQYIYNYNSSFEFRFPIICIAMALFSTVVEWIRDKSFSELKIVNSVLEDMAYVDDLTRAPNFNKFQMDAEKILKENENYSYITLAIDIVDFKIINDKYGYQFGNDVLKDLAEELRKICEEDELYARVNGDRFVMLLKYEDRNLLDVRLLNINDKLRNFNHKNILRYHYGVYEVENEELDIWTLYDRTLMAMEISKDNMQVKFSYYNDEIRQKLLDERYMEESMESALFNREFLVLLQPKYSFKEERYCGAEALVRWKKKDGVIIPPGEFISFFEKKGYITKIDMYVLREVCKNMKRWLEENKREIVVSVNISKMDFYKPNFINDLIEIVDSYGIPHRLIELEMTETMAAESLEEFITFSNLCRAAGFPISLDDFGTGYSSLTILKDLPIDVVKLDKTLFTDFRNVDAKEKGDIIVEQIIDLCKKINLKVVAEGVEDKELADKLRAMKCDMIQGYYYGKPMLPSEFETHL
ncbi:bifunctional diguanylate cyclase/phosphodiesterase [Clostridium sp. MSJ-8]|uniref:putative bifunctional diguanylate cyclase/phosphodiesterase n=1 Tax=Clostridium sp. MSJ-8 TaxID=2841510 RepID=UPI001C0EA2E0|nr:bifunctional diguanylate cyclase/phosphodiesterase [Clostridium sp. MSJ-8]MBU5487198.1 bifunctional diguanylate cyclase/phosphodiesterase [Clostridium sp. MSJ-8]